MLQGSQRSRPRIAIVTAVSGAKDRLEPPANRFESADYLVYTDDPDLRVEGWEVRQLPQWSTDPVFARRRHARAVKILQTMLVPGYDFYIWHDGTHEVVTDPAEMVLRFLPTDEHHFAVYRHKSHRCIYEEARRILKVRLDNPELVHRQIRDYRKAGMPRDAGLWETGVLIRRNSEVTRQLELAWWDHLAKYSSRDQLSLPFVEWSLGIPISPITGGNVIDNDFVRRVRRHRFNDGRLPLGWPLRRRLQRLGLRILRLLGASAPTEPVAKAPG